MRVSLALALIFALLCCACTLPAGEPCCLDDVECSDGARCFEGRCALRCHDDSQCEEGDTCVANDAANDVGLCVALVRAADDACAEGA